MQTATVDRLSPRQFARLAEFIEGYSGIKMPAGKQTMLEGRLRRRVRANGHADFAEYCAFLFDQGGLDTESVHLIDAVTTNKTEFFREPEHFRVLVELVVPELLAAPSGRPLKLWSAACSIGAEPYTLAMVMAELAPRLGGVRANIFASDISTEVLQTALAGIYPEDMMRPVPPELRQRYVMRAKDRTRGTVRIVPELRAMVKFARVNLTRPPYPIDQGLDVIFLRNILIYFDKPTQQGILQQLCTHLHPGGFLFLGHSETLTGLDLPVEQAAPTVFRRC